MHCLFRQFVVKLFVEVKKTVYLVCMLIEKLY